MGCCNSQKQNKELELSLINSGAQDDTNFMIFIDCSFKHQKNDYSKCLREIKYVFYLDKNKSVRIYNNEPRHFFNAKTVSDLNRDFNQVINHSFTFPLVDIIEKSIKIVNRTQQYYVSIILTDKDVKEELFENLSAVYDASYYPLSIIVIGVGNKSFNFLEGLHNNDFEQMGMHPQKTRAKLRENNIIRIFDNFTFIKFDDKQKDQDVYFEVIQTISKQYRKIKAKLQYKKSSFL